MKALFFTIKDIAAMARQRIQNRKDAIIFWTGPRGSGKSTGAWRLSKKIGSFDVNHLGVVHTFKKFKPRYDMIYDRDSAINFMMNEHYSLQMIDELINIAYNREFAQSDQQAFIKAINQYRSHFNIINACMPFFFDLDPDLRNMCWMRIEVIRRGLAVIHTPNDSQYSNDPWDTEYNKKIERSWRKKDGTVKPRYSQLTTFRGFLVYNPLKPAEEQFYESIRNDKRAAANKHLQNSIPEKQLGIYDNLIKMGLDGKLTKELFDNILVINNIIPTTARSNINKLLKEKKLNKTYRHLIAKETKNDKEDDNKEDDLRYKL